MVQTDVHRRRRDRRSGGWVPLGTHRAAWVEPDRNRPARSRSLLIRHVVIEVVPEQLRQLLTERGMTGTDLSRLLRVSKSAASQWLTTVNGMTAVYAIKTSVLLGVPLERFCHVREDVTRPKVDDERSA